MKSKKGQTMTKGQVLLLQHIHSYLCKNEIDLAKIAIKAMIDAEGNAEKVSVTKGLIICLTRPVPETRVTSFATFTEYYEVPFSREQTVELLKRDEFENILFERMDLAPLNFDSKNPLVADIKIDYEDNEWFVDGKSLK